MFRQLQAEEGLAGEFIKRLEWGTLESDSKVMYCTVYFDIASYSNGAYSHYGITLPEHIASSVRKRRAEFLAGRICCKKALSNIRASSLEVGSHLSSREPQWPQGINGSISHCGSRAIAVVTTEEVGWLGVDIEDLDQESMIDAADMITTRAEQQHLAQQGGAYTKEQTLLLAFSAKEALFKALYPQLKFYFGFECAIVDSIDESLNTMRLRLNCALSAHLTETSAWTVHFAFSTDNTVVTLLLVPP